MQDTQYLFDWIAIRELTARYNRAFDGGDVEAWVACFTVDGVFEIVGGKTLNGASELRGFATKAVARLRVRHCTTDAIIEIDGDRARQDAYLLLVDIGGGSKFVNSGNYRDDLVKEHGSWKFARRSVVIDAAL